MTMMCRARLTWRLPARDRRWRTWSPDEASIGAVPFQVAASTGRTRTMDLRGEGDEPSGAVPFGDERGAGEVEERQQCAAEPEGHRVLSDPGLYLFAQRCPVARPGALCAVRGLSPGQCPDSMARPVD